MVDRGSTGMLYVFTKRFLVDRNNECAILSHYFSLNIGHALKSAQSLPQFHPLILALYLQSTTPPPPPPPLVRRGLAPLICEKGVSLPALVAP